MNRTYCIAKGTSLNILQQTILEKNLKKNIYINLNIYIT